MKYGESAFDILYLLTAVVLGVAMLVRAKNRTGRLMGTAALVLGLGDAFHLVPRVMNYFAEGDFTAALGIGKLVTSLTMTVFYVFMYYIWLGYYRKERDRTLTVCIWALTVLRFGLCAFPQNGWLANENGMLWGILRNVPFVLLGILIVLLYYKKRNADRRFRHIWLYVTLSFLFYIPVAVFAGALPILGMLMLPKTVCYVLLLFTFYGAVKNEAA
ncbi:MAG: hypothetical protein IJS22_05625 [Lachnospiraceae bacterium]|nr:hypothetical protein [Lachnospiraceae bacterium]